MHARPPSTMPRAAASAALLLSLALAGGAQAAPKDEVQAATKKMLAAKSWHAEMRSTGAATGTMSTSVDFAAPDRYRLKTPQGTQLIIGDTMHLAIDGRTMAVPLPKGALSQWRDPAKLAAMSAKSTVTALGSDPVGGQPAKKYETRNADQPGQVVQLWIGAQGYPLRVRSTSSFQGKPVTTVITYSRYDDPKITVAAP